ncbi:MFS transporter [Aquipuribacter hungaricus]|uniref:MFS transporter n=1 Tax=Aquipuribacter hungaricus TaxID=545624 RepID=A0ABV7WJL5_9MICO
MATTRETRTRQTPVGGVLALFTAATFAAITTEMLPVGLLPLMSSSFGVSDSRTGLLVSAYAAVVVLASVPLTAVVARWPRRTVLVALLVAYAASNLVLAAADGWWVALACRLLAGLAHAGFFSVVVGAAVALVPPDRVGRAVAAVSAGNALALVGGVPLGTALGTALGWRWAFVVAAVVLLLLAAATLVLLPKAPAPAASAAVPVLQAVRERPLQRVALVVVVLMLGHFTLWTYVSPLLLDVGVPASGVGLVLLGYGGAGVVGLLLAGAVVDRHLRGATVSAVAATALLLLALGLLGVAPDLLPGLPGGAGSGDLVRTLTVAVVVAWGAAFGMLPTLLQTLALRASPASEDAAPALVNASFNVGIAGGGLVGAQVLLLAEPSVLALVGAAGAGLALALLPGRSAARR